MRHIIETGTDGAALCFFDAAALPKDFDSLVKEDAAGTFEKLQSEQRFWWQSTDGDGGYLFHFYVGEDVPEKMVKHLTEAKECPNFLIPSGTVWACGAEYAALDPLHGQKQTPKGGLEKYAHMGSKFQIDPGKYKITAWRTEWPEGMLEAELERRLGKGRERRHNMIGTFTGMLLLGLVITTAINGCRLINSRHSLGAPGWITIGVLWGICLFLMRTLNRMERNPLRHEIQNEFPDIVVRMSRIPET